MLVFLMNSSPSFLPDLRRATASLKGSQTLASMAQVMEYLVHQIQLASHQRRSDLLLKESEALFDLDL